MELSKNILRGLEGYGMFLERNPEARGRVVHYALTYPSRRDLPEYQAYTAEVKHMADSINERFPDPGLGAGAAGAAGQLPAGWPPWPRPTC